MEGKVKNNCARGISLVNKSKKANPDNSLNNDLLESPGGPNIIINSKTKNTTELLKQLPSDTVDKNLDNVLEAVKMLDIACVYTKCKAKTNLMGQYCEFCKEKYCFKHGLPEIHGCGEAVKNDERKKFLQPKTMKTIRQEQDLSKAKKKLEGKLKDMRVSRMVKISGTTSGSSKKKK